jgi:hypothetical protein
VAVDKIILCPIQQAGIAWGAGGSFLPRIGNRLISCDGMKPEMDRQDDEEEDANRQTRSLAGLAIILGLAVLAIILVQHLRRESQIEDCLLAHHVNCDALLQNQ